MKSEKRHELQENSLVHLLESGAEKVRPHTSLIFGIIGLALGALIVGSLWSQRQSAKSREAWDHYELAMMRQNDLEREDLLDLANNDQFSGSEVREWAYLAYADRQVRQAAEFYLVNRESSLDRLENVKGIYEELAGGASTPDLRDRARLGLARVLEMQNRPDEAIEAYEAISGTLAPYATERIKQLESPSANAAAEWLATAELPSYSLPNSPGTPGMRPEFDAMLPSTDATSGAGATLDPDTMKSLEDVFGGSGEGATDRYGDAATTTEDSGVVVDGETATEADTEAAGEGTAERDAEANESAAEDADANGSTADATEADAASEENE